MKCPEHVSVRGISWSIRSGFHVGVVGSPLDRSHQITSIVPRTRTIWRVGSERAPRPACPAEDPFHRRRAGRSGRIGVRATKGAPVFEERVDDPPGQFDFLPAGEECGICA